MQVAISTVFGPLKDHPSQATPRAGGELGVIEIRHQPNEGGRVRLDGAELSQWLPWHFDHCYNDELNRAGVLRAVEIPPDGGRTGFVDGIALYDAISPELRDRIEGETVLYAMDVILDNLRFGRPADFVEVEASPEAAGGDGRVRRPTARAASGGLDARAPARRCCTCRRGWRRASSATRTPTATRCSPRCATRSSTVAQRPLLLPPVAADRHGRSGTTGGCCTRCRAWHPTYGRCMHRTTIKGDYGLGASRPAAHAV